MMQQRELNVPIIPRASCMVFCIEPLRMQSEPPTRWVARVHSTVGSECVAVRVQVVCDDDAVVVLEEIY